MILYRWLHISDLHFKTLGDPDQSNIVTSLINACKSGAIQADFVVATGDFHEFDDVGNFELSIVFLRELLSSLCLDISTDLFIVPGNHDLEPNRERSACLMQFFASEDNTDYAQYLSTSPSFVQAQFFAFKEYCHFASSLIKDYDYVSGNELAPETVHVRTWKNTINILHLNTALISNGKRDHLEAVDIVKACSAEIKNKLDNGLPTLVLGHHSFYDLHVSIRKRLVQLFNQTNVWAYLAGDRHVANIHDEDYLIDRKIGVNSWPNIVAERLAARAGDSYSQFGLVRYQWDEQKNLVTPEHIRWANNDSGYGFTQFGWDSIRTFPMLSAISSALYFYLMERLIETRANHPSFQLMKIDESLYPNGYICFGMENYKAKDDDLQEAQPLAEFFRSSWQSTTQNHLMLEGEGGIGKTVALLSLVTQTGLLPHNVPAIYIPLHSLIAGDENSINRYIREEVLQNNKERIDGLFNLINKHWETGPRLVLLLDGFNEIAQTNRNAISLDIENWSNKKGVQIITASRYDIRTTLHGISGDFRSIKLQPLSREVVSCHLKQNNIHIKDSETSLWDVISFPLMLTLFTQTESLRKQVCSIPIKWLAANSAGSIMWNYLQQELFRCARQARDISMVTSIVLATEYITPYIAWQMVKNNQFSISEDEFEEHIKQSLTQLETCKPSLLPKHIHQVIRDCGGLNQIPNSDAIYQLLTKNLNLFRTYESSSGSFLRLMHQQFRDCFAAIHLVNLAFTTRQKMHLPIEWKQTVDYYVMNFTAELIQPTDLDFLWELARASQPTETQTTVNMLELYKRIRNFDFTNLDFSELDLREVNLYSYKVPENVSIKLSSCAQRFKSTCIGKKTFSPEGHSQSVNAIVLPENDRQCVSASSDTTIKVWDTETGRCVNTLEGHTDEIYALCKIPDKNICVSSSADHTLRIWDLENNECQNILEGHTDKVKQILLTPDGKTCISASKDYSLKIWNLEDGSCINTLLGHKDSILAVKITFDGSQCISSSWDGEIIIWDIKSGTLLRKFGRSGLIVDCLCIVPDGKRLISTSWDRDIYVWNYMTGELEKTLSGSTKSTDLLYVTQDGRYCLSAHTDGIIQVWDLDTGTCQNTLVGHKKKVIGIASTSNGKRYLSASLDGTLRIWDSLSGNCLHTLEDHSGAINAICIKPDGRQCISASSKGTLQVWDLSNGKCKLVMEKYISSKMIVSFNSDCKYCMSISNDLTLRGWDLASGRCLYVRSNFGLFTRLSALAQDGSLFLCAVNDTTIEVWDFFSGTRLYTLGVNKKIISDIIVSPNAKFCITTCKDSSMQVWDLKKGKLHYEKDVDLKHKSRIYVTPDSSSYIIDRGDDYLEIRDFSPGDYFRELKVKAISLSFVCFSQDSSKCFTISTDGKLLKWDLKTGMCEQELNVRTTLPSDISVSPEIHTCVSVTREGKLAVWDLVSEECLQSIKLPINRIRKLQVSSDFRNCMCIFIDGSIGVWDLKTAIKLLKVDLPIVNQNTTAIISPDGRICISTSRDESVRIWDILSGNCIHTLRGHKSQVNEFIISPDSKRFYVVFEDGIVESWEIYSGKNLYTLNPIFGLNLDINLTQAIIDPIEYSQVLQQNGVIVS